MCVNHPDLVQKHPNEPHQHRASKVFRVLMH